MTGAYGAACTAANARILATVEQAYSHSATELLLNGHRTVELLDARLVDLDLATLTAALSESNPFERIDLSYNELGAGAASSLAEFLKADSKLQYLDLSHNDMESSAIEAICLALKSNTTLREVHLSGNKLGGVGGMAVAEMLQANPSLQALHLSNCELTSESLVALATVLRDDQRLHVLDVSRPLAQTIMDEPAQHFARMLKVNATLVELDLSKAGLRDFGLRLLSEEIYRAGAASALSVLRMRCNKIQLVDADAVDSLSMLLSADTCRLTSLDLGSNELRDEGALKLAEMVVANRSLVHLDVTSNGLMSRGLCALAKSVGKHFALDRVMLWGNGFDSAACYAWKDSLSSNGDRLELDVEIRVSDRTAASIQTYHCARR